MVGKSPDDYVEVARGVLVDWETASRGLSLLCTPDAYDGSLIAGGLE